jgi:hypothetical protein
VRLSVWLRIKKHASVLRASLPKLRVALFGLQIKHLGKRLRALLAFGAKTQNIEKLFFSKRGNVILSPTSFFDMI